MPGERQRAELTQPRITSERQRRIPLSGKVVMEDGTAPLEPVRVESFCGGRTTIIAFTDSKGGFSEGSGTAQFADARTVNSGSLRSPAPSMPTATGSGCVLRASLPGFRSTEMNLMLLKDSFAPVTLILHPAAKVEGLTISATSVTAPKDAQKAFEKATKAMRNRKWDDALGQLEKAVRSYPGYAAAWSELGNVYAEQDEPERARNAFHEAIVIDPKFLAPYFGLAELAMHERKWHEMTEYTTALLKLDPYNHPGAYAYDAMAQLNLNHLDAAETSAREGLKIDQVGEVPKNHHLLGVILMRKGDYAGAAGELRKYLEAAPQTSDGEFVKRQLAACESGQTARAAQPAATR